MVAVFRFGIIFPTYVLLFLLFFIQPHPSIRPFFPVRFSYSYEIYLTHQPDWCVAISRSHNYFFITHPGGQAFLRCIMSRSVLLRSRITHRVDIYIRHAERTWDGLGRNGARVTSHYLTGVDIGGYLLFEMNRTAQAIIWYLQDSLINYVVSESWVSSLWGEPYEQAIIGYLLFEVNRTSKL